MEHGGARRDRTADLLHAMQALSQLSYSPTEQRTLRRHLRAVKKTNLHTGIGREPRLAAAISAAPRRRPLHPLVLTTAP